MCMFQRKPFSYTCNELPFFIQLRLSTPLVSDLSFSAPSSHSKQSQSTAKRKLSRTRKKGYQFDEESDDGATQIVTEKSLATPTTPGLKKAPPRNNKNYAQQRAVDETLVVAGSSGIPSKKLRKKSKTESQSESLSHPAKGRHQTKRKGQIQDDKDVSNCKLRKQATIEEDSQDIETVFFTEGNAGGIKMEAQDENELTDVEGNTDTVNVEQNTNHVNDEVKNSAKQTTQDENNEKPKENERTEIEMEKVNDNSRRKPSDDTVDDFLDIIMGNDGVEKRKAPPPKRKAPNKSTPTDEQSSKNDKKNLRRKNENEQYFDSVIMSQKRSTQNDSSSQDSSIFSELDEIYNDPTKWKKNKRSPRAAGLIPTTDSINTMIMEDNEKYEQLFKTGKMKKKTR